MPPPKPSVHFNLVPDPSAWLAGTKGTPVIDQEALLREMRCAMGPKPTLEPVSSPHASSRSCYGESPLSWRPPRAPQGPTVGQLRHVPLHLGIRFRHLDRCKQGLGDRPCRYSRSHRVLGLRPSWRCVDRTLWIARLDHSAASSAFCPSGTLVPPLVPPPCAAVAPQGSRAPLQGGRSQLPASQAPSPSVQTQADPSFNRMSRHLDHKSVLSGKKPRTLAVENAACASSSCRRPALPLRHPHIRHLAREMSTSTWSPPTLQA
jgi:hypothetical protein